MRRYHVDVTQAQRVGALAKSLHKGLEEKKEDLEAVAPFLDWAARLHEIGMSIAQAAYHKHSAYILANADMPGFSRQEQGYLSNLVLAQRGKLAKMGPAFEDDPRLAALALCLRLAVTFYRSRRTLKLPRLSVRRNEEGFTLSIDGKWLSDNGLVAATLEAEREQWDSVGLAFEVVET
jgi:exopolyphosphatase/guanosine-5'-triphosphate,3'-diphosphate pyrophosphatase